MASPAISAVFRRPFQPLVWWHLLSLDAPTIAALWCVFLALVMGVSLPIKAMALLATGVWSLYVLDRILDGLDPSPVEHFAERHYFYARHRKRFLAPLAVVSACGAFLLLKSGTILLPAARHDFLALAVFLAVYYLLIHSFRKQTRWFPKELTVGVFFSSAIAVPTLVRLTQHQRSIMILPVIALGVLCWLNCIAITRWEADVRAPARVRSFWPLVVASFTLSIVGFAEKTAAPIFFSILVSTLVFVWLELKRYRHTAMFMRVAADCALLTPLLALPFLLR